MKTQSVFSILVLLACALLSGWPARGADAVEPASCTITNFRDEAQSPISSAYFFQGSSLRFTNCTMYAGATTNSARQGLDGVEVELRVGTLQSNVAYLATVNVASSGVWSCDVLIPTNTFSPFLQVKVTDANTNVFIYPWKTIFVSQAME